MYRLSEQVREVIDRCLSKYPKEHKQSAVLAALHEVQHENCGYLTVDRMDAVADYLDMPSIAVYEVASFYSMFSLEPVGRHCISICTNISCMLQGADALVSHAEKRLGIKTGQSTADRRFYLKREEECLAACCGAPAMQIDHVYYEHLTPEKLDHVIEGLD